MRKISPHRVLLLRSVARSGSLSRAAELEGFTISAVSQHMKTLEREAGMPLLERHSRGVTLTQAGNAILLHADVIAASMDALQYDLAELRGGSGGTIRCGVFPTLASSVGPPLLLAANSPHVGLRLKFRSARLVQLKELLRRRELDIALTWDYHWDPQIDKDLINRPIMRDSTILLVPSHLIGQSWRELLNVETAWISRNENHMIGRVLERIGADHGFTPRIVYKASDWAEVQGMVAGGLGVAIAPALAASHLRQGVSVMPFPTAPARTIYLTKRQGQSFLPGENVLERELMLARASLPHLPE